MSVKFQTLNYILDNKDEISERELKILFTKINKMINDFTVFEKEIPKEVIKEVSKEISKKEIPKEIPKKEVPKEIPKKEVLKEVPIKVGDKIYFFDKNIKHKGIVKRLNPTSTTVLTSDDKKWYVRTTLHRLSEEDSEKDSQEFDIGEKVIF